MTAKNLFNLFRQDLTISLRNSLVWFMGFTALLMIVLVRFALPSDFQLEQQRMYWYDGTQENYLGAALEQMGLGDYILESPQALEEKVAQNPGAIGVIYQGSITHPRVTLITNGEISAQSLALVEASLEQIQAGLLGATDRRGFTIQTLNPGGKPIPPNMASVPILLTFEVLITGFMLVAVLMFQEKQEGSIRAYRISPGTTAAYIFSKTLVFTLLGLVYGTVFVLATMGLAVNWPALLAAMALGAAFYTLLGIALAVFFSNLSEWFVPGFALLVLNFLPIISYAVPTFSPRLLTLVPSYYAVFGFGEILFPTGASLLPMFAYLGIGIFVVYTVCHLLVHHKMMKEGR